MAPLEAVDTLLRMRHTQVTQVAGPGPTITGIDATKQLSLAPMGLPLVNGSRNAICHNGFMVGEAVPTSLMSAFVG